MRLVNSLVLGLLVQRGITQTDVPADDIATVADPTIVDQPTVVEPIADPTLDGRTIEEPTAVVDPTDVDQPTFVEDPTFIDEPTDVDEDPGTQETTFREANPGFLATTAGGSPPPETTFEAIPSAEPTLIEPSGTPTDDPEPSPSNNIAQGSIAGTSGQPEPTALDTATDDDSAEQTEDGDNNVATATDASPSATDDSATDDSDSDGTNTQDSADESTAAPTAEATADEDSDGTTAAVPERTTEDKPEPTADTDKEPEKTTIETRVSGTRAAGGSTATTSGASSSTASVDPVELKLTDATVDENCVITEEKGKPAIKMTPPPNGEAAFSLEAKTSDDVVPPAGTRVRVKASIRVRNLFDAGSRLEPGQATNCSFKMFVDGSNVYDRGLAITGDDYEDITSNDLVSSENPKVDMKQECGDSPVELTVNGATLTGPRNAGSNKDDGDDSGSGSETNTAVTVPTSSGTASDGNGDDENDAGISVVNKVVVCALSFVAVVVPVFL